MDLAFISLIYGGVCVYCYRGHVCEGVGKSNAGVTGRVSTRHSLPNHEPLFFLFVFFKGAGCRTWLVTKTTTETTRHESPHQPTGKFVCNSRVSTSRGWSLYTLLTFLVCKIQLICTKMSRFRPETILNTTKSAMVFS